MHDVDRFVNNAQPPLLPFDLKVLLFYGVARSRMWIVTLTVVGTALGVLVGASQPNVYTAEGKLRYQTGARQMLTDESIYGVIDPETLRRRAGTGVEDLQELLRDPAIYESVVATIGAREILRVDDPSRGESDASLPAKVMHQLQGVLIRARGLDDPCPGGETELCKQAAAKKLLASVVVRPIRDTSLLQVTYSATSPAKAKRILDALIEAFVEHHLYVYGAGEKLEVLKERSEIVHQELQRLNTEYQEYQEQCGFYDIDGDYLATNEQIRIRQLSVANLEIEAARLVAYVASLEEQLSSGAAAALGGQTLNPDFVQLVDRRKTALATIAELESRSDIGEMNERKLKAARKELEVVEALLPQTAEFTSDPYEQRVAAQNNPVIAEATLLLATSRAELDSVASKVTAEKTALAALNARLVQIRRCQPQHDLHRTALENTRASYRTMTAQLPALDSLALLDQEGKSNLTVFRKPVLPLEKDGPQRSKPMAMGLAGGLGLGIGLAVLRQLLERRIRYPETLENALGLRVLCVVPEVEGLADGRRAA